MRDALLCDEALPDEVCYIRSHAVLVPVIMERFKILARNGTELTKLSESPNFRRSDGVRYTPKFVCLPWFGRANRFFSRCSLSSQARVLLRVVTWPLFPREVGTARLAVTGNQLGCSAFGIEGFAGHVIARHASPPPFRGMERLLPSAR